MIRIRQSGFFGALPSHPHGVQTVAARAGLEANKARRNGAPVPRSAAAGCGGRHANPGADRRQGADWILMLITTALKKANVKPLPLVYSRFVNVLNHKHAAAFSASFWAFTNPYLFHGILNEMPCCLIRRGVQKVQGYSLPRAGYSKQLI